MERHSNLRLALLVLEGYAYFVLTIGIFVAEVTLLAWGLLARRPVIAVIAVLGGVPLVITTASAIRALFFRISEPDGISVSPEQVPALHAMVEAVQRHVRAPRFHRILVTGVCNASALQVPRVGLFWPRNTLLIGYPLLVSLSAEQLRAVIAHELGHLSAAHGRLTLWAYRARRSWTRLVETLNARGATPLYVYWLFRWYVARLQAHSARIARAQEAVADRCAAAAAGSEAAAAALVAVDLGDTLLEEKFWPAIIERIEHDPEPPEPYALMGTHLWRAASDQDSDAILKRLLARDPGPDDTHHSLEERLRALGQEARLPERTEQTAADVYLGGETRAIAAQLDATWQASHASEWRAQHAEMRQRRQRLAELAQRRSPTAAEIFERGELLERLEGQERALPHYHAAVDAGHGRGALAAARILLARKEERGIALAERAMAMDPALEGEACTLLASFYRQRSRFADAQHFVARANRHAAASTMAEEERARVGAFDRFEAHGLEPAALDVITGRLAADPGVLQAYLVEKHRRHSPGTQLVMAIVTNGSAGQKRMETLRAEPLPDDVAIVMLTRQDEPLRAAIAAVPGACIYERARRTSRT
jgi:Zn-dependent protease with chaperone function